MQDRAAPGYRQRAHQAAGDEGSAADRPVDERTKAVFVYSGFRASSTWFWGKFRAHEALLCYYEPFNEQLGSLALHNIGEARPASWRSHHPSSAPYVLEYAGLLENGGGVSGFPVAKSLGERYIGAAGLEGTLDEDVAAYVRGLIDHAHDRGRMPLLSCTRLLGRTQGLKAAFGGYHILLVRNLFHQWNSYAGQARFGNWYFLQTLFETLEIAPHDPVIAHLAQLFSEHARSSLEAWVAAENFDMVFCYFVGFHLYFLTVARRSCDLVVNINALADPDPGYRQTIVAAIEAASGIRLDLEDASERVDFPLHPVADRQVCKILIDEFAAMIKAACRASEEEQAFIDGLVHDLWAEHAIFRRQTSGAFEYLAQIKAESDAKLSAAQQEADAKYRALMLELEAAREKLALQESEDSVGLPAKGT